MSNPMEIMVTLKDDLTSRLVQFSELYAMRERIGSLMLLWNTNSYYVDSVSRTFIINGGRRTKFNEMEDCRILYRRRTKAEVAMNSEERNRIVTWLIGIESRSTGSVVFIEIGDDGVEWKWNTKL